MAHLTPIVRRAAICALPLFAAVLLTACSGPERELRDGLVSAGLSQTMAACMAKPMAKELSLDQLMKLRSLGRAAQRDPRRTSYDKLLRQLRALNDPEIIRSATTAALDCSLGI